MTKTEAKWFKTKLDQATRQYQTIYDIYKNPSSAKVQDWTKATQIIADLEEQLDGDITTITVTSYNTFMFTVTAIIKSVNDEYIIVITPEQVKVASIMEVFYAL